MFIKRDILAIVAAGAQQSSVIAIIGPRQAGKSTLVREMFKKHRYLDMQDAGLVDFANQDPKGFLQSYQGEAGLIIDEAQYAPNLFAQLKVEVDKNPRPGYYILSGSQNFLLHEKISESLAGRVYFYTLLPFSIKELTQAHLRQDSIEDQICKGFYPRVYAPQINAQEYYANYISTYVERDIRSIRNIENILTFKKFMQLCALRIGSMLNLTDLATNCGISVITAKGWLSLLEASYILFLLPSYHENLGKRITKSPKLYFYDVGLAVALMGINKEAMMKKREQLGVLFENMVIVDAMKNFNAQGIRPTLTFFRDSNQREVDLIIEAAGSAMPLEIKLSKTMDSSYFNTVTWFAQEVKSDRKPVVVYGGEQAQDRSIGRVVPWTALDMLLS